MTSKRKSPLKRCKSHQCRKQTSPRRCVNKNSPAAIDCKKSKAKSPPKQKRQVKPKVPSKQKSKRRSPVKSKYSPVRPTHIYRREVSPCCEGKCRTLNSPRRCVDINSPKSLGCRWVLLTPKNVDMYRNIDMYPVTWRDDEKFDDSTRRDGNSLFESLAEKLYGTRMAYNRVRQEIVRYTEKNPEFFRKFMYMKSLPEEFFEDYLADISTDGEYGGDVTLVAAANLYNRIIHVIRYVNNEYVARDFVPVVVVEQTPEVRLYQIDDDHFGRIVTAPH